MLKVLYCSLQHAISKLYLDILFIIFVKEEPYVLTKFIKFNIFMFFFDFFLNIINDSNKSNYTKYSQLIELQQTQQFRGAYICFTMCLWIFKRQLFLIIFSILSFTLILINMKQIFLQTGDSDNTRMVSALFILMLLLIIFVFFSIKIGIYKNYLVLNKSSLIANMLIFIEIFLQVTFNTQSKAFVLLVFILRFLW